MEEAIRLPLSQMAALITEKAIGCFADDCNSICLHQYFIHMLALLRMPMELSLLWLNALEYCICYFNYFPPSNVGKNQTPVSFLIGISWEYSPKVFKCGDSLILPQISSLCGDKTVIYLYLSQLSKKTKQRSCYRVWRSLLTFPGWVLVHAFFYSNEAWHAIHCILTHSSFSCYIITLHISEVVYWHYVIVY